MANSQSFADLMLCHVNCQSLRAHFDEFSHFFLDSCYHVICMSETWLRPEIPDAMIGLPGYNLFRWDRVGKHGGGVAFYLQDSLGAEILAHSSESYDGRPEYIIAEIKFDNASSLLLAVIYRPPNSGYLQDFERLFLDLQTRYLHSIIIGDLNADLTVCSYDSTHLNNFIASSNLFLVPYQTTHHLRTSSSLLDLCIIDDQTKLKDFGQHSVAFLSAHDLIYVKYDIKIQRRTRRLITCRNYRQFNEDDFIADVLDQDWPSLFGADSINYKVEILNNLLLNCYDKHAPLQRFFFKNLPAPWITSELKDAMRERDLARRIWRRKRDNASYTHFKSLRNSVQSSVRSAKRNYYSAVFDRLKNPREIWDRLRHLGLIKAKDIGGPLCLSLDALNDFFVESAGRTNDTDRSMISQLLVSDNIFDDGRLYWSHISPSDVCGAFARIRSNATGSDGIAPRLIKVVLPYILPIIEHIFNFSLMQGVFPDQWKSALVCPIPKTRNPTEASHYRPISILPVLSKMLERVVGEQISAYLEQSNLLDSYQAAYRKGYSTQTYLIRTLDEVRHAADNRMVTVSVFFDLSKAFDRVQHHVLLKKLKDLRFSCSALRWISSYLLGRTQVTHDRTSGTVSAVAPVEVGVPQGSVLGPLLFCLYLSDFRKTLRNCKYNIYADDLQIYLHCKPCDLVGAIARINIDVASIIDWATLNGLILNASKTQAIILGTSRYINSIDTTSLPSIVMGDAVVRYSSHVKYLGVTIASNLSWERHVSGVTKKVRSALYRLKLCKHLIPVALKSRLITALILPYFDYCTSIFTDITSELDLALGRAMNACLRYVYNVKLDEHITPYYHKIGWLKTSVRRHYFVCCLLFNIIRSQRSCALLSEFSYRAIACDRVTRAPSDLLALPQCRTELYKRSFRSTAARLWNALPSGIRNAESIVDFKSGLYAHLLTK